MVHLWGRQWSRSELLARVGRLEQLAGVQLTEAADGAERGVRLLRFATGAGFDFEVLVDRGFDIGRACLGGRPLAWWSPVGLIGPWYYEPAGIGWFRGFPGGLVSTCGLDHMLLGGTDDSTRLQLPAPPDRDLRPARPVHRAAGPAGRLRHALARGRLRALGRSRGPRRWRSSASSCC